MARDEEEGATSTIDSANGSPRGTKGLEGSPPLCRLGEVVSPRELYARYVLRETLKPGGRLVVRIPEGHPLKSQEDWINGGPVPPSRSAPQPSRLMTFDQFQEEQARVDEESKKRAAESRPATVEEIRRPGFRIPGRVGRYFDPLDLTFHRKNHGELVDLKAEVRQDLWACRRHLVVVALRNAVVFAAWIGLMLLPLRFLPTEGRFQAVSLAAIVLWIYGCIAFAAYGPISGTIDDWGYEWSKTRMLCAALPRELKRIKQQLRKTATGTASVPLDPARESPLAEKAVRVMKERGEMPVEIPPGPRKEGQVGQLEKVASALLRRAGQTSGPYPLKELLDWRAESGAFPLREELLDPLQEILTMQSDLTAFLCPADGEITEEELSEQVKDLSPEEAADLLWEEAEGRVADKYPGVFPDHYLNLAP